MNGNARFKEKEAANLDNDHRQRVNVRLDGGGSLPALLREYIEKLWSGPTDGAPGVGHCGIDRSDVVCDRRETKVRKKGATHRIDENVGLGVSPTSQHLRR